MYVFQFYALSFLRAKSVPKKAARWSSNYFLSHGKNKLIDCVSQERGTDMPILDNGLNEAVSNRERDDLHDDLSDCAKCHY